MPKNLVLSAFIVCGLISSAFGAEADTALLQQGEKIVQPFKQQLKQALQKGMAGGPVAAVEVCQLEAPFIAQAFDSNDIRVGRSSHRLRNQANSPAPWMQAIIDDYLSFPEKQRPVAVQLPSGRVGYAEPILTQPLCLVCHGEDIDPIVENRINELYPEDQATGFQAGELRGIFWAEFVTAE